MKHFAITLLAGLGLLAAGCQKDNITPPTSQLTGRITFQNQALNVRGLGGVQLELWQRGERFRNKIQVNVTQEGTYSANLFDGDYKMTRLRDNGPWQNNTDSIDVKVQGNTVIDVPVQPYFTVGTTTATKSGSSVTASTLVTKTGTRDIEYVTLYLNYTQFVDNFNQIAQVRKNPADLTNLSQPLTFTVPIPSTAKNAVYARIGVKTQGVSELVFSPVQKITL